MQPTKTNTLVCFSTLLRLLFACVAWSAGHAVHGQPVAEELELDRYWTLSGVERLEPSGLSFCGETLVVISDRHDDQVYQIPLSDATNTRIKPYRTLAIQHQLPPEMSLRSHLTDQVLRWTDKRYDWEGIHCDQHNRLYLASESLSAIAAVDQYGTLSWVTPSLSEALQKQGFLNKINTGFEGITADNKLFVVAIEREPRGLATINKQSSPTALISANMINSEDVSSPLKEDFTGLWMESQQLYTLERNYFRVCKRRYQDWVIQACWSYYTTEKNEKYRFHNDQYGMAEGIARQGNYLYIVLDNNQTPRRETQKRSPLLFRFLLPKNW